MNDKEKLKVLTKGLNAIINYPTKKQGRRTKDGYPAEIIIDEWAYKRMVDSFRDGLKRLMKDAQVKYKKCK
jgi:hypothetical protein